MNYVVQSTVNDNWFRIRIIFNASSRELECADPNEFLAIVDCPSAGLLETLAVGKDVASHGNNSHDYYFICLRDKQLTVNDSEYNNLYMTLLYKNRILHKHTVEFTNTP